MEWNVSNWNVGFFNPKPSICCKIFCHSKLFFIDPRKKLVGKIVDTTWKKNFLQQKWHNCTNGTRFLLKGGVCVLPSQMSLNWFTHVSKEMYLILIQLQILEYSLHFIRKEKAVSQSTKSIGYSKVKPNSFQNCGYILNHRYRSPA